MTSAWSSARPGEPASDWLRVVTHPIDPADVRSRAGPPAPGAGGRPAPGGGRRCGGGSDDAAKSRLALARETFGEPARETRSPPSSLRARARTQARCRQTAQLAPGLGRRHHSPSSAIAAGWPGSILRRLAPVLVGDPSPAPDRHRRPGAGEPYAVDRGQRMRRHPAAMAPIVAQVEHVGELLAGPHLGRP